LGQVDIAGLRAALDQRFTRRMDLSTGGAVYLAEGLTDLNEVCSAFISSDDAENQDDDIDAYWIFDETLTDSIRTLIDFEWTFEAPPAWDDRVQLLRLSDSRTYVWLPPADDIGRAWVGLAAIEPPDNRPAYEWLLAEIWGAGSGRQQSVFGEDFDLMLSLPTDVTIKAPECLSLEGIRRAVAKWVGDDPRSESWGEVLDRVERAVRYRGPTGALRQMQTALEDMEALGKKVRSEPLESIIAGFAGEEARAADHRSRLLATVQGREQLLGMYGQLCCRVAPARRSET
jgi:hypothetical protein